MTNKEKLQVLAKEYGLVGEDFFKSPQGWLIITRQGIDKIQEAASFTVEYEVLEYTPGKTASIKAIAQSEKRVIQTYGSAIVGDFKTGTTRSLYTLEIAEKRAMSRAVLKLAGFYALGVMGQDEPHEDNYKEEK